VQAHNNELRRLRELHAELENLCVHELAHCDDAIADLLRPSFLIFLWSQVCIGHGLHIHHYDLMIRLQSRLWNGLNRNAMSCTGDCDVTGFAESYNTRLAEQFGILQSLSIVAD
jgi:hypothetical protein